MRSGTVSANGDVTRRFHLILALAAAVGLSTGLAVWVFDVTVSAGLDRVLDGPLLVTMVVPAVGLVLVGVVGVRWLQGDIGTTDAYVRAYHERGGRMPLRGWPKLVLSAISLGSGAALGFEGPSMLIGGTLGSTLERRFAGRFQRDDAKVLMVAGAAAGVAAVFKAPLTGIVFALEVPYRADLARRALLPCLVAAGTAYVVFVSFDGVEPLLAASGPAPFDLRDLGGGLALGLVCGVLARLGARAIGHAKHLPLHPAVRIGGAAIVFAALAPLARGWFDAPLHLGPSYDAIEWAASDNRTLITLAALFAVRAIATWVCVGGGGVGGLFIPLVTQGAIVGSFAQELVHPANPTLFPTVGIAAFLGAGYRTPLAGVAFVAEATGEPGFLVPALLAAAAAQLVMGRQSFSADQRLERLPEVEPLTRLSVREIMTPNPDTLDAACTIEEAIVAMGRQNRRWMPVADGNSYVGLAAVADLAAVPREEWPSSEVRGIVRLDVLPASPDDPVSEVARRLRTSGTAAVAVTSGGAVVGVVTLRDLANVEVLLDRLTNEPTRL